MQYIIMFFRTIIMLIAFGLSRYFDQHGNREVGEWFSVFVVFLGILGTRTYKDLYALCFSSFFLVAGAISAAEHVYAWEFPAQTFALAIFCILGVLRFLSDHEELW